MVVRTFCVVSLFARTPSADAVLAADRRLLATLARSGADLSRPRQVRHYLYVADERTAVEAVDALALDYDVEVIPCERDNGRLVVASRDEVVCIDVIAQSRCRFEELARTLRGGDYDGWDAAITASGH